MPGRQFIKTFLCIFLCVVMPMTATAGMSLFRDDVMRPNRGALIPVRATTDDTMSGATQSLFTGRRGTSLFAPRAEPDLPTPPRDPVYSSAQGGAVERIRYLIGRAESHRDGYDAVQHGARIKPGKRPTEMTLGEINAWIDATPRQPHAIGRYQFIPKTLRRLIAKLGVGTDAVFNPRLQDALSDILLAEAGLHAMTEGAITRHQFMNNLAKIWAGLPNSSGKSHYHGYAGNKASMSWASFDSEMAKIFPS